MASASTSLISNLLPPFLGGLLFLSACGTGARKASDEEDLKLSEELEELTSHVQRVSYGPTITAGGAFKDKTIDYGLDNLYGVALNAVDFNRDGHPDLAILPTYYSRPKFFIFSSQQKKFLPWTHDPLPADFKASFMLFYDINKDQVLDLISGVLNQRSEVSQIPVKVYAGVIRQGLLSFEEQPELLSIPTEPTSSISLLDYDLDGWPDLFIGNWYENRSGDYIPVADRLFRNNRGKFAEVTPILRGEAEKTSSQIYPPNAKPTYGSSTCDIDQNGYPDILTASSSGQKNKLWMNLKDARTGERYFEDVGATSNYGSDPDGSLIPTGGGRTFFSACTDYNNDGLMDVFLGELSHAYDNDSVDRSSILTGSKETFPPYFLRTEYLSDAASESWNQGDRRGVWVDYNLDGRIDLLVDNSGFPPYSRLVLFEQDETHAFVNVASQAGVDVVNPTGTVVIDLNQDGRPDIVTSQNNIRKADILPRLYVLENQSQATGRKAVRVHVNGIRSNSNGIGAMVMLYTIQDGKKIVQRRWNESSQGGLSSQNQDGVHFGVEAGTKIAGVKVRWPYVKNGTVQEKLYGLESIPFKDFLEVTVCEDGKVYAGKITCP